jgi:hypothetical protein
MNSERIKEIQQATAYPKSVSVQQALLKVWNECESEHNRLVDELKAENEKLKAEIPKWISVDERLPKECESILMFGDSVRSSGIYMKNEFHADFNLPLHKDVTHWMPLPPTEK